MLSLFPAAQAQAQAPDAPTNLVITPGDGYLHVSWTAPSQTVTHYRVGRKAATATSWADVSWSGTGLQISLPNGVLHDVRVRAVGSGGSSPWVYGSGTPNVPITVSLSAEQTTINEGEQVVLKATLSPELSVEEARARGFPVEFPLDLLLTSAEPGDVRLPATIVLGPRTGNSVHVYAAPDADTDDEVFQVDLDVFNVPPGFEVGSPSAVRFTIKDDDEPPPQAALPPVTSLRVSPGDKTLTMTWTQPTGAGSSRISHTIIRYKEQGAGTFSTFTLIGSTRSTVLTGLKNGVTYEVEAQNLAVDESTVSSSVYATGTPNGRVAVSDIKLNVQVTPGNRKLTLRWTLSPPLPGSEGPGSYDVQYREKYTCYVDMTQGRPRYVDGVPQYVCNEWGSDGPGWFSHGSGPDNRGTTRVINGLTPGTEYEVRVRRGGSQTNNWFYATGRTAGSTNPRLRSLQLNQ